MSRLLSYSEIQTALTCQARHAFQYTGHLTKGETLRSRAIAPILSDGRAWGAAVASWHAFSDDPSLFGVWTPIQAKLAAHEALRASYAHDIEEQAEAGVQIIPELQVEQADRLSAILDHYMASTQRLRNLTRIEDELETPIPSRTGKRGSSRYRFHGFLDGFTVDQNGNEWIVEFKLRTSLTPVEYIELSRQIRWYAWVRQKESDHPIVGALVDERLAEPPKPARLVQGKRKGTLVPSHAKDQLTTPDLYFELCREHDVDPRPETVEALKARQWQQRQPILFRAGELEEAGKELISAAKLVRDLDSGELYPIRNSQTQICRMCRYRKICANPLDDLYIDTLFERTEPKRLRPPRALQEAV